jgi:hypothetical protein
VTFKASGQTGVSIAVGESAFVYYNGTDYVKVSSTVATGVTSFTAGTTGFTPSTATTGAVTLAGTLATTNGGTGLTSFTSGGVVYASSSSALATGSALNFDGTTLGIGTSTFTTGSKLSVQTTGGKFEVIAEGGSSVKLKNGGALTLESADAFYFNSGASEIMRLTASGNLGIGTSSPSCSLDVTKAAGANFVATFQNTTAATPYCVFIKDAASSTAGYPLLAVTNSTGSATYFRVDSSTGNVGIGTSSPSGKLHVSTTGPVISTLESSAANGGYQTFSNGSTVPLYIGFGSTLTTGLSTSDAAFRYSNNLVFSNGSTEKARFSSSGGFSVGTTSDPGAGAIYATGNITAYYSSDIKFKENVRDIPDALATVNAIGGKLFDWKDDYIESKGGADGYFVQKADFGVVAQDVQKVFPIAVRTREDGSLAVDYEKLGALAFAALVELTKRVEALEAK